MRKKWSYFFGVLLSIVFLLSGIWGIFVENIFNHIFKSLGMFLILINSSLPLDSKKD